MVILVTLSHIGYESVLINVLKFSEERVVIAFPNDGVWHYA